MVGAVGVRNRQARALFAPLGPTYDRYATLLSFGQDPRWRRYLVSRIRCHPGDTVLDVATGTGAVAIALARARGCSVVGVDQSAEMLAVAERRIAAAGLSESVRLVESRAEDLPFDDASFGALTFTYLLRYVEDPAATLRELARVVRPGGTIASLEFAVPARQPWRALWEVWVRVGLPAASRIVSPGWGEVGRFLGPSIRSFYREYPLERLARLWRNAGVEDVHSKTLSVGGAVVTWGRRGR